VNVHQWRLTRSERVRRMGLTVVTANACVEGFMVHLRNLIDFMWPTRIQDTDVVAEDYCPTDVWSRPLL
jgi:hypothetical protein